MLHGFSLVWVLIWDKCTWHAKSAAFLQVTTDFELVWIDTVVDIVTQILLTDPFDF